MNVYLIRQEHSHLYGNTLESAVVIAESIPAARRSLKTALYKSDCGIIWDETLWAVTKLGNNAKHPPEHVGPVVCRNVCAKNDLPRGNYGTKS